MPKSKDEIAATIEKELWIAELAYLQRPMEVPDRMVKGVYDVRHPAHDTLLPAVLMQVLSISL